MPKQIQSKTGSAPIVKQGHTATSNHGSNPDMKARGRGTPRNLEVGRGK